MGDKRVLLGKANDGSSDIYGLWVSKTGTSVINTSTHVLADPEDMLFNSSATEIAGNVLASGSLTITFSGSNLTTNSGDVYFIGNSGSHTTFDYVPLMLFCRVSGNNVFPLNTSHGWVNLTEHGPLFEPRISTANGHQSDAYAIINKNKFVLHASRHIQTGQFGGGTIRGMANGDHDFHWAALAMGEATVE